MNSWKSIAITCINNIISIPCQQRLCTTCNILEDEYHLLFIYSNCILHPYGSSNYNTKACKHIKEKQHKHNKYVNVEEIFDRREPYHLKSRAFHQQIKKNKQTNE
jgi:hypothetical protein